MPGEWGEKSGNGCSSSLLAMLGGSDATSARRNYTTHSVSALPALPDHELIDCPGASWGRRLAMTAAHHRDKLRKKTKIRIKKYSYWENIKS